jgi:hypothetical protein
MKRKAMVNKILTARKECRPNGRQEVISPRLVGQSDTALVRTMRYFVEKIQSFEDYHFAPRNNFHENCAQRQNVIGASREFM